MEKRPSWLDQRLIALPFWMAAGKKREGQ